MQYVNSICSPCPDLSYLTDVMNEDTCKKHCVQYEDDIIHTTTTAPESEGLYCYNVTEQENITTLQDTIILNQTSMINVTVVQNVTRYVIRFVGKYQHELTDPEFNRLRKD